MVPITWLGRLVAGTVAFMGVFIFALASGILGGGLMAALKEERLLIKQRRLHYIEHRSLQWRRQRTWSLPCTSRYSPLTSCSLGFSSIDHSFHHINDDYPLPQHHHDHNHRNENDIDNSVTDSSDGSVIPSSSVKILPKPQSLSRRASDSRLIEVRRDEPYSLGYHKKIMKKTRKKNNSNSSTGDCISTKISDGDTVTRSRKGESAHSHDNSTINGPHDNHNDLNGNDIDYHWTIQQWRTIFPTRSTIDVHNSVHDWSLGVATYNHSTHNDAGEALEIKRVMDTASSHFTGLGLQRPQIPSLTSIQHSSSVAMRSSTEATVVTNDSHSRRVIPSTMNSSPLFSAAYPPSPMKSLSSLAPFPTTPLQLTDSILLMSELSDNTNVNDSHPHAYGYAHGDAGNDEKRDETTIGWESPLTASSRMVPPTNSLETKVMTSPVIAASASNLNDTLIGRELTTATPSTTVTKPSRIHQLRSDNNVVIITTPSATVTNTNTEAATAADNDDSVLLLSRRPMISSAPTLSGSPLLTSSLYSKYVDDFDAMDELPNANINNNKEGNDGNGNDSDDELDIASTLAQPAPVSVLPPRSNNHIDIENGNGNDGSIRTSSKSFPRSRRMQMCMRRFRRHLYLILEPPARYLNPNGFTERCLRILSYIFQFCVFALVVGNVALILITTKQAIKPIFAITFFTCEYLARIWTCIEDPKWRSRRNRRRLLSHFGAGIDDSHNTKITNTNNINNMNQLNHLHDRQHHYGVAAAAAARNSEWHDNDDDNDIFGGVAFERDQSYSLRTYSASSRSYRISSSSAHSYGNGDGTSSSDHHHPFGGDDDDGAQMITDHPVTSSPRHVHRLLGVPSGSHSRLIASASSSYRFRCRCEIFGRIRWALQPLSFFDLIVLIVFYFGNYFII
jgi:hypothetical protein